VQAVAAAAPTARPQRAEVDPAVLALIERFGPQILRTARRFSATLDDAEDAYQRALEILLTKAPTTNESELVPWLKTVVKHEAFAVRRQRERTPVSDDGAVDRPGAAPPSHEQAERYEQLRLGAEAMQSLKPQEIRALLLKAEGYSYKQIQEITGWSYTKVNRCLTEGRASFVARVAGIESGDECRRIAPLLSAMADGEASSEDMSTIRPHLRGCLACRATLREFRAAPSTLGALLPPALVVGPEALRDIAGASAGVPQPAVAGDWLHERITWLGVKLQQVGERVHAVFELGSAQKVAAVAAATAAVAGGGTAAVKSAAQVDPPARAAVARHEAPREARRSAPQASTAPARPVVRTSSQAKRVVRRDPSRKARTPQEPMAHEFEVAPAEAKAAPPAPTPPEPAAKPPESPAPSAEFGP
jgi:RNA polymerase sigma factor (sigma-70 family)